MEDIAVSLAGIAGTSRPPLTRARLLLFCADHGVAKERVSAFSQEATSHLVSRAASGSAAVSIFCRHFGVDLQIIDIGMVDRHPAPSGVITAKIRHGTRNFVAGPAMVKEEVDSALMVGASIVDRALAEGINAIGLGEIGIGNTTSSAALMSALLPLASMYTVGYGTGITTEQLARKRQIVTDALLALQPDPNDPLDCLAKVGGYEIAGMAGAAVQCAKHRIPVVIDGFTSTISALIATRLAPEVRPYLFFAHRSHELGHDRLLRVLEAAPLVDLDLGLGEGTGAVIGLSLLTLSATLLRELNCF